MNTLDHIVAFLREIGLKIQQAPVPAEAFLPGIYVERGGLRYDPEALVAPGDLLHEAGHLAVVPAAERAQLTGHVGGDAGFEMGAIAWSYAACCHLGLPPEVVFHKQGYQGSSTTLIENFSQGRYLGVPILVWRGLTDPEGTTAPDAVIYPAMRQWLSA